jgi:site-specific recombinase XerD
VRAAKSSVKIHSLRHGFARALVQNGVSIYMGNELLRHEDIRTTENFSYLQKEGLVKVVIIIHSIRLFI